MTEIRNALWVKGFSGLCSAFKGVDTQNWNIDVIEDYQSLKDLTPLAEAEQRIHNAIEDDKVELIVFEDPMFYQYLLTRDPFLKSPKILCPTYEEQRLERDRSYATEQMKNFNISTLDRLKIGPYPEQSFQLVFEDMSSKVKTSSLQQETRFVLKVNNGHMIGMGTLEQLALLIVQRNYAGDDDPEDDNKWNYDHVEFTLERQLFNHIELSLCCAWNGYTLTPFCTLLDPDNRIFPKGAGPKLSDVGQVLLPEVAECWTELLKNTEKMLAASSYPKGWFDIDLMVDVSDDPRNPYSQPRYYVIEVMQRFSNPTFAAVIHLAPEYDWLDMMTRMIKGEEIQRPNFDCSIVIELGVWSVGIRFNDINSSSEGTVLPRELFKRHEGSGLCWMQIYDSGAKLYCAGDMGRTAVIVKSSKTYIQEEGVTIPNWYEAMKECFDLAKEVYFSGMIVKDNLYGYHNRDYCDADLTDILVKLSERNLIVVGLA